MKVPVYACAGNTFAIAEPDTLPHMGADLAREICRTGFDGRPLDGVLVRTDEAGDGAAGCRMIVYNADGSRPEACGDGLLCMGARANVCGLGSSSLVRVDTDAGPREVHIERAFELGAVARGILGEARVLERGVELEVGERKLRATTVSMGNPHCVLFLDELAPELPTDLEQFPVGEIGPALERHPDFQHGTNVEFALVVNAHEIRARVWERGVGETMACGTGACAIAAAAVDAGRAEWPVHVNYPGGRLSIGLTDSGEVWMEGVAEKLGDLECPDEWRESREARWSVR